MPIARHDFSTPEALANALADHVAAALTARLSRTDRAALAVSGGRTPTRFFAALAQRPVEWARVDVTLVDERWVGEDSDRSNAALVRQHLLQGPAAAASFVPLHIGVPTPEDGMAQVTARIAALAQPFAAVVLGMGDDGHTASFFPGGDRLVCGPAEAMPIRAVLTRSERPVEIFWCP